MKLHELYDQPVTQADLNNLERYLDALFKAVGIDIEWTRHFLDRINDPRNKTQITIAEVKALFQAVFKKFGKMIADKNPDWEAMLNDLSSQINIPFVLNWNKRTKQMELVTKTIMRKKNFTTRTKVLKVST